MSAHDDHLAHHHDDHSAHPLYAPAGHDAGLPHDLQALARQHRSRRGALQLLGAGAALAAAGAARTAHAASCALIPEETAGPYPGDGSNMANGSIANALMLSGIVRSDIRSSMGSSMGSSAGNATGTAAGQALRVMIQLVNTNGGCASLAGYAVYLWHCTRDGLYSMYSSGVANQNYLRGVQVTDSSGAVTFTTIFPGCYAGRMPHIHFEVYRSATTATSFSNKLRTSQMAFPTALCQSIYSSTSGYEASVGNLARISFATDNVFSDGVDKQMATMSAERSSRSYLAALQVGIAV